jgi:hypothetical protein
MTWEEFLAARQVLTEERIGAPLRKAIKAEQNEVDATKAAIRSTMPK